MSRSIGNVPSHRALEPLSRSSKGDVEQLPGQHSMLKAFSRSIQHMADVVTIALIGSNLVLHKLAPYSVDVS